MIQDPITGPDPSTLTPDILAERLATERALREQSMRYLEKALELQADEYERRLTDLNHSHQRALEAQARTVSSELFDAYVREQEAKLQLASEVTLAARAALAHDVSIEREARVRLEGSLGTWRAIAGFLGVSGVVALMLGLVAVFGPGQ